MKFIKTFEDSIWDNGDIPMMFLIDEEGTVLNRKGVAVEGEGIFDEEGNEYPAGVSYDREIFGSQVDSDGSIIDTEGFNAGEKYIQDQIDKLFLSMNESYIKTFESFHLEEPSTMSELLEKLSVVEQNILDSVQAELVNIDAFFNGDISKYNLEDLSENAEFNNVLRIKGLKKSNVEYTDDYETFLLNPFKYILIRDNDKNNLQNPDFIIIQTFNSTEQDWNSLKMYKINGNFKNFYDKLSSRTIELDHEGKKYIYQTSNKNEWELTNQEETDNFPRFVRKEDLLKIINKL